MSGDRIEAGTFLVGAGMTRGDGKTVITLGGLPAQPYSAKPNGDRKVQQ